MSLDAAHCYEVVKARDPRYDGVFFVGVSTTGVYCRPVCRVRTPGRDRCSYFPNAASAEAAGFRPCLRCRPELAPGAAPVDSGSRLAAAAVARIDAGALGEGSVQALAEELGIGARQLRRVVEAEYGVSPLALAQTRRLLLAKQLLTDTSLRVIDVAFASGFNSVRQFNRTFREQYRLSPVSLRRAPDRVAEEQILLKLGYRPPLAWPELVRFLAGRAGGGTEKVTGERYLRTVCLRGRRGFIVAEPLATGILGVRVSPSLLPVLPEVRARLRRLFDLDASPIVIDSLLGRHPELRASVERTPGLRVPGAFHGFELALRAILGQQVSVKAASTLYGRFVDVFGERVETPEPDVSKLAPEPAAIADASLQSLIDRGLTRRRAETVQALARAVVGGALCLDPPVDLAATRAALRELPGVGPWTTEYVAMRALGDPDAFPHSDLGLLNALSLHRPGRLLELSEGWRPFRAYAALHLWHGLGTGG